MASKLWQFFRFGPGAYEQQLVKFNELQKEREDLATGHPREVLRWWAAERDRDELVRWWAAAIPRLEAMPLLWKDQANLEVLVRAIEFDFGRAPSTTDKQGEIGHYVQFLTDHIAYQREAAEEAYAEAKEEQVQDVVQRYGLWSNATFQECIDELERLGAGADEVGQLFWSDLRYLEKFERDKSGLCFEDGRISFDDVRKWLEDATAELWDEYAKKNLISDIVSGTGSYGSQSLSGRLDELESVGAGPASIRSLFWYAGGRVVGAYDQHFGDAKREVTFEAAREWHADFERVQAGLETVDVAKPAAQPAPTAQVAPTTQAAKAKKAKKASKKHQFKRREAKICGKCPSVHLKRHCPLRRDRRERR